ncbi:MAG TPA: gamma-glutamyl-gamma-aminobutyrate hydrolase family protein [Alphaproteobacteria bacterium]|nr:gamma-glutamyl-gamma-aminobutyrate hydrolase family protein [Alphaproteobacteria bacterium]
MLLILNICKHQLHYTEFIKPIEDIARKQEIPFDTIHYSKIKPQNAKKILGKYHRIIITGTSLKDMGYSKDLSKFKWLLSDIASDKPILGICGGMQLLCMIHGCKLIKNPEIGLAKINFNAEFLGINGQREVYALHNMAIKNDSILKKTFNIYSSGNKENLIIQAVKHKGNKHYGVLFHPEVRNKDLIVNFLSV